MLQLTVEQCKEIQITPLDYEIQEREVKDKNFKILKDLLDILKDKSSKEILRNKSRNVRPTDLMTEFYKNYMDTTNSNSSKNKVISSIKKEVNSLHLKIHNFAHDFGFNEEDVFEEICKSQMLLSTFCKSPQKQSFHQHCSAHWISSLPFIENFCELQETGKNALYIENGKITKNNGKMKACKSIDFQWEYSFGEKVLYFYGTHKYTKDFGGAQDNQYVDVQNFLSQAKLNKDDDTYFVSITDGPYYLKNDGNKLKKLKESFDSNNIVITYSNDLGNSVIPIIINWLKNNFEYSK